MRKIGTPKESPEEASDLTTRARIRDAAIKLFAEQGYAKTSVRAIAETAKVSPALINHHFGSKNGLRSACNEYVANSIFQDKASFTLLRAPQTIGQSLEDVEIFRIRINYLLRMFQEGGPETDALFEELISQTQEYVETMCSAGIMTHPKDPHTTALLLTMFGVAPLLLHERISASLGDDPYSPQGAKKLSLSLLELLSGKLYSGSEFIELAMKSLMELEEVSDE